MNKWRKTHSGIEGEEMTAAQLAEYKKIKAELREARTGGSTSEIKRRPSSAAGVPAKNTIRLHPSAKEGNHPGTCVMCHCPGGVAFRAATPWRNRGMSDIPQSAVKELANFCDVSSSHELRTNPPVIDGSTKPWNAGGVATSPEGRCAGSCSLEGLEGVSAPPQGPQLPCLPPTWQGVST